jgi:hypothetical protein
MEAAVVDIEKEALHRRNAPSMPFNGAGAGQLRD